jgi:uncharacterized protein
MVGDDLEVTAIVTRELKQRQRRVRRFAVQDAVIVLVTVLALQAVMAPTLLAAYPKATGNINDYAGVLTRSDKENLEALVNAVLKQTGTTFAVAIVNDHGDESIEEYAVHLYETWGVGQEADDKGLLVVVSMKEHDLRAEVGYGLEPVITDARAGESLDEMIPYFQNGEYGKGLYAGLLKAAEYVAKDAGVMLDVKAHGGYEDFYTQPSPVPFGLLALFLGLPVLLISLLAIRGRRCPRCKARLTVTDRVIERATYDTGGLAMTVLHCPKCGYHDERPRRINKLQRPVSGGGTPLGPGPFWGGFGRGGRSSGGSFGPRGFGGGRSGGGGASRKW